MLEFNKFDPAKLRVELKDLRMLVQNYYLGVACKDLWERIFRYRKSSFPNLFMLVEIVLSFGPSNALVEAGFSHLTYMLNDQRLHMSHETMEDLLVLKVNQYAWSSDDVNEIIQNALKEFMSAKRRKLKLDDRSFAMLTKARQNFGEETYPVVEPPDEDDLFDEHEDDEDDEPLPESMVEDLFSKLQADGESDSY